MTEPTDTAAIAVALAELRGTMAEGFATVNGGLNLVAQRSDQTERAIADLDARLDAVEHGETERQKRDAVRLDTVERRLWPLPSVAAVVGAAGLGLSAWQALGR